MRLWGIKLVEQGLRGRRATTKRTSIKRASGLALGTRGTACSTA